MYSFFKEVEEEKTLLIWFIKEFFVCLWLRLAQVHTAGAHLSFTPKRSEVKQKGKICHQTTYSFSKEGKTLVIWFIKEVFCASGSIEHRFMKEGLTCPLPPKAPK